MTIRTALVPLEATEEMDNAFYEAHAKADTIFAPFQVCHAAAIAASPRAGRVGLDVLEMAAASAYASIAARRNIAWAVAGASVRALWIAGTRAAFEAAGLAVEEAAL